MAREGRLGVPGPEPQETRRNRPAGCGQLCEACGNQRETNDGATKSSELVDLSCCAVSIVASNFTAKAGLIFVHQIVPYDELFPPTR